MDEYLMTKQCMTSIGIDDSLQLQIYQLLSGILNLGNIIFLEDTAEGMVTGVDPSSEVYLQNASEVLGVTTDALLTCIIKQNMHVNGATIVKPQKLEQVCILIIYIYIAFLFLPSVLSI